MLANIDWTEIAAITTGLVALATFALAIGTFRLVRTAKNEVTIVGRQAEATEQQAKVSASALAASIRPWLNVHQGPFTYPGSRDVYPQVDLRDDVVRDLAGVEHRGIEGHLVIRNSGNGLAVIPKDSAVVWGRDSEDRTFNVSCIAFPQSPILAPGEVTVLEFFVEGTPYDMFIGSKVGYDFYVHVLSTDADGGQPVVASFRVIADPAQAMSVFEITYRNLESVPSYAEPMVFEETQPFAVVRPGLPGESGPQVS